MMGGLERQSKDLYLGKNTVIMFQEHHGKDELKKPYFSQFYFVFGVLKIVSNPEFVLTEIKLFRGQINMGKPVNLKKPKVLR